MVECHSAGDGRAQVQARSNDAERQLAASRDAVASAKLAAEHSSVRAASLEAQLHAAVTRQVRSLLTHVPRDMEMHSGGAKHA